jgi:hypothetical protein
MYFLNDDDLYFRVESEMKFLESNSSQTIDYKLVPSAYLKYKIHNVNCFDENDEIQIFSCSDFEKSESCLFPLGGVASWLFGCSEYEFINYISKMSGKQYLHWIVTKNNITTHHYDTITLAPYEQRYYEILY